MTFAKNVLTSVQKLNWKGKHTAHLTVQSKEDHNQKEQHRPQVWQRHGSYSSRVGQESQTWTCDEWRKRHKESHSSAKGRNLAGPIWMLLRYYSYNSFASVFYNLVLFKRFPLKLAKAPYNTSALRRTWLSHFGDVHSQLKRHEAEDGEDGETGKEAGQTVEHGQVYSVPAMGEDYNVSSLTLPYRIQKQEQECIYL